MTFGLNVSCYFGLLLTSALFLGEPDPELALDASQPVPAARFVGTDACVHCHKGGHDVPSHATAGKEYSIWVSRDPHSRAYNTLFGEQSKSIAHKLKLESAPHKSDLCLACHATHVPNEMMALGSKLNPADGVGCESCHGGAENWLVPHKLADWPFWSAGQRESAGFVNTDNFASRARKCVECHVGSEGREVNHDLIAAGHPRLLFEMSAYQAMLPRHWSRAADLAINAPEAEAKLWLVGQVVTASVALNLLEQRANNANSPWPEFAEYDCTSCHHDLAEQRWKDRPIPFGTGDRQPNWGTWHFAMLNPPSPDWSLGECQESAVDFGRLRIEMQKALPDRNQVTDISHELQDCLAKIADRLSSTPLEEDRTARLSEQLFRNDSAVDEMNWDQLAQRYLAAVAFRQSTIDSRQMAGQMSDQPLADSGKRLMEIRDLLKFCENYQRPELLDAAQINSIHQRFIEIFDLLENWR